jgi:hypothetical protein
MTPSPKTSKAGCFPVTTDPLSAVSRDMLVNYLAEGITRMWTRYQDEVSTEKLARLTAESVIADLIILKGYASGELPMREAE